MGMIESEYNPTVWQNGQEPPLNAANLNKIENQLSNLTKDVLNINGGADKAGSIANAKQAADAAQGDVNDLKDTVNTLSQTVETNKSNIEGALAQETAARTTGDEDTLSAAKSDATEKDTALHTTISGEIDADVEEARSALQANINKKLDANSFKTDANSLYLESDIQDSPQSKAMTLSKTSISFVHETSADNGNSSYLYDDELNFQEFSSDGNKTTYFKRTGIEVEDGKNKNSLTFPTNVSGIIAVKSDIDAAVNSINTNAVMTSGITAKKVDEYDATKTTVDEFFAKEGADTIIADVANLQTTKLNVEDSVGKKTANGGEVFNDYVTNNAAEYAHAEGLGTIANGKSQHVQGRYNEEDTEIDTDGYGKYAHIIGGGTASDRKNIHTIDWDGNAYFAGTIKSGDQELATQAWVKNNIAGIDGDLDLSNKLDSNGFTTDDGVLRIEGEDPSIEYSSFGVDGINIFNNSIQTEICPGKIILRSDVSEDTRSITSQYTTSITSQSISGIKYTNIAKKSDLGTMASKSADDYLTTSELDERLSSFVVDSDITFEGKTGQFITVGEDGKLTATSIQVGGKF